MISTIATHPSSVLVEVVGDLEEVLVQFLVVLQSAGTPGTPNNASQTGGLFQSTGSGGGIFGTRSNTGTSPGGSFSTGGQTISQTGFGPPSFQNKTGGFGSSPPAFGTAPSFGGAPTFGGSPTFGSPGKVFGSASPTSGLDFPTSVAVDPQNGKMFWADAGISPKIEIAWMDGSKRKPLVTEQIRLPSGLTIDYARDHSLYWVDTKLNNIEVIRQDGSNRATILRGEKLHHPLSLDVFENNLYWTNRDLGEVVKQDKFGRGLAVVLVRNLINPTGVKTSEPPLHAPRICKCQNGYCEEDKNGDLYCNCFPEFRGQFCDIYIQRARVPALGNMAALLIPLTLLLVVLAAAAIYIVIRKRTFGKGTGLGGLTNSQSVSFRQGTNVEFCSPTFSSNGPPIGMKL
ncbi:uncharacterized protein LOC142318001 [Lycorma delicatula]|uniref:uncharacterized protein LOC142318001 n=1 Tax=Lycorma delicatula TaxID=130591 RepID=UPI003F51318A